MQIDTQKIKKIMEMKNLTAHDLALIMGKRDSWVYNVLAGNAGKTFGTVESFAKALNVTEKEIVK